MNDTARRRRRLAVLGLVVTLLLLGVWGTLHFVRTRRDAELETICAWVVGLDEHDAALRFEAAGLQRDASGNTVSYSGLTSWLQSYTCVARLGPTGRVIGTFPFRITRQEASTPWRDTPGWSALGRLLVSASIPLTP